MKSALKPLLLTAVLAASGFAASAQGHGDHYAMMGGGSSMHEGMGHHRMGGMDPARMQARMDKRHAELKALLKLTPAQEGAWATLTEAMKPPAGMQAKRPDPAELAKLPTPERIDKMKALRTQHMNEMNAAMDKRGDAAKALYATLTPEQQKVFDANTMGHRGRLQGGKGPAPAKS